MGFPGGSEGKESACNAGDADLIPGLERSPGEQNGFPLQDSCLENPMGRGTWQATVHGVAESQTQLRDYHFSLWPKAETLTDIPGFSNQMGILLGEVL